MKKLLVLAVLLIAVIASGCGDKFAKEKEAITKAEQAAMAMKLPVVERPDFSKMPKPTNEERQKIWKKYNEDFGKLVATEEKILEEMRKSDAQIAEMEKKAESDSDKKNLKEFKDKLRKDRIEFVKRVSKGRLYGDPFIVGCGSTWQEVEMVYGKPINAGENHPGSMVYKYDGIIFEDWIGGGVLPLEVRKRWKSRNVEVVTVTRNDITSDAGVKFGMTPEEVQKTLKAKYVKKSKYPKNGFEFSKIIDSRSKNEGYNVMHYSMKDTEPLFDATFIFEGGKLIKYIESLKP